MINKRSYHNIFAIGLALLLMQTFTTCTNKEPSSNDTNHNTYLDVDSTSLWDFEEYNIPLKPNPASHPSIISENEIYFCSGKNIYLFNGSEIKVVYSEQKNMSISFATDGEFIVYFHAHQNVEQDEMDIPYIIVGVLLKDGKTVTIGRSKRIDLPFSNAIQSVSFITQGVAVITGIMEYAIIEFNESNTHNDDIEAEVSHFAIRDGFSYSGMIRGTSAVRNILIFSSPFGIYYLNSNEADPKMKLLFSVPDLFTDSKTISEYPKIGEASYLNSYSVAFKTSNGIGVYQGNKDKKEKIVFIDTIYLGKERIINGSDIATVSARNENEFWVVTRSNLLISITKSGDDWQDYACNIISVLPPQKQNIKIYFIDYNRPMILGDDFIYLLKPSDSSNVARNEFIDTSSYHSLLTTNQYWDPGNTYGIAISDIDNDGEEEAYLIDLLNKNKLYLNIPPDTYTTDITTERGLIGKEKNTNNRSFETILDIGITCGDIDEDGDEDFVVAYLDGTNCLFLNNGDGYFKDATEEFGLALNMWRSECVILGDINNDGYLDLFATSFLKSNRLFLNDHGIKFTDVTNGSGLRSNGTSVTACFGDVNDDGYLDLYVGNWMNENKMYINNGDGTFKDFTEESGVGCNSDIKKTNSVMFADFDNDGDLDLFVGNRGSRNNLFINNGEAVFSEHSSLISSDARLFTYGATFCDIDNNGWLDILVNHVGGTNVFINKGIDSGGMVTFNEETERIMETSAILERYNTSIVTFDEGKDGDIDLLIGQYRGRDVFLKNNLNNRRDVDPNFIDVKVIGTESNRSAIGTKLSLYNDNKLIGYREISSGFGYASSSSKIQHFGISNINGNYELAVEFPASGIKKRIAVQPGAFLQIEESSGIVKAKSLLLKDLHRVVLGKETFVSLFKLFLMMIILFSLAGAARTTFIKFRFPAFSIHKRSIFYTIIFYISIIFFLSVTQEQFFEPHLWVTGTSNIFLEDIIPLILAILFFTGFNYYNYLATSAEANTFAEIFPKLKKFGHGEGMAVNLTRLNNFVQNIELVLAKQNNSLEIENRFHSLVKEFREVTYLELIEISKMLITIKDKSFISKSIKRGGNIISLSTHRLIKQLDNLVTVVKKRMRMGRIPGLKKEIDNSINNIRDEVSNVLQALGLHFSCNVSQAIILVLEKFKSAKETDINIQYDQPDLNEKVIFKETELYEILSILIQNAIQAVNESLKAVKEIHIEVLPENSSVKISIEDTGIGISEEKVQKLFTPGFTTKVSGQGFGLHYVKQCIEKYGGKIECDSEIEKGSTFTIELIKVA